MRGDGLGDGSAVLAHEHHRSAKHRLVAVAGSGTRAQLLAECDFRDITDRNGKTVTGRHHQAAQVFDP